MLVVTSNWWVSDGTLSAPPPRRLVARFRDEVRRSSLRCGFGHDGRYRPVESIDVVLAGDTFDWLVSREWTGEIRPWHAGGRAAVARDRVTAAAVRRGRRLLATLVAWMRHGIPVPVADRRGRPMAASRPVPVRVAVLSGDRDRWLEQAACGRLGTASTAAVGTRWSDGEVMVQHGESLDPLHTTGEQQPTLGESLAVDLIAVFGAALHDDARFRPLAAGLVRHLAGGCPTAAASRLAVWLAAHERRSSLGGDTRQNLIDAWHRAVDRWQRSARRLPPRRGDGVDMVARVAGWLELHHAPEDRGDWQSSGWSSAASTEIDSAESATVVLGHPEASGRPSSANHRRVVCLGPRSFPAVFADDPPAPAAVVVRPGRAGRLLDWLPLGGIAAGAGDDDDDRISREGTRGVWLSDAAGRGHGIVDAA